MSEQATVAISQQKSIKSLLEYFGYTNDKSIPISLLTSLQRIYDILALHQVDTETAVGLIKSYEAKVGQLEDAHLRIDRLKQFVEGVHANGADHHTFVDQVKNMGLMSKSELEEHAKETGDWAPFLKRAAKDQKSAQDQQPQPAMAGGKSELDPGVS